MNLSKEEMERASEYRRNKSNPVGLNWEQWPEEKPEEGCKFYASTSQRDGIKVCIMGHDDFYNVTDNETAPSALFDLMRFRWVYEEELIADAENKGE